MLGTSWSCDAFRRVANASGSPALPILARLAAVLEMAKTDVVGQPYPPTALIFGVLGERVKRTKKAWETCVLRAHGHEPQWANNGKLSPESRAALRMIDLRFHDLAARSRVAMAGGGLADSSREGNAGTRQHQSNRYVPERRPDGTARVDEAFR